MIKIMVHNQVGQKPSQFKADYLDSKGHPKISSLTVFIFHYLIKLIQSYIRFYVGRFCIDNCANYFILNQFSLQFEVH